MGIIGIWQDRNHAKGVEGMREDLWEMQLIRM